MRRMIHVYKETTPDVVGFKIYFYPDTNIVVSKSGPVDLVYDPEAEVKTKIIYLGKEYALDSSEFTVYLNNTVVKDVNISMKQDKNIDVAE